MTFKIIVHNNFLAIANAKINLLLNTLAELKTIGANETKSTAGDKHETALAMVQIEQAKTRNQLTETQILKDELLKLNPALQANMVCKGSLIKTNKGYFYISAALGKTTVNDVVIMSLSPQSPLGIKLLGLAVNGIATINNMEYIVEEIQ